MNISSEKVEFRVIQNIVQRLNLKLSGLTVVTELASKYYMYTPLIAAIAGAKVYALGKDTRYGSYQKLKKKILKLSGEYGVSESVYPYEFESFDKWNEADIITNSGMLRPFGAEMISLFKPTAVIPLMWEPWELRPGEIDIQACQNCKIPVIGTNENFKDNDMYAYPGMLALHILHNLESDYSDDRILLLGGGLTGTLIKRTLNFFNANVYWFAENKHEGIVDDIPMPFNHLVGFLENEEIDVVLIAEHSKNVMLFGRKKGLISFEALKRLHPNVKIGHLCGNIASRELRNEGINYFPERIAPFGYMSILPDMFGSKPTLKLMAGGLKVGEIAARARLDGKSVESAIQSTVEFGLGMDFPGGFLNFRQKQ